MQDNREIINTFLMGRDPMERIISIECDYNDEKVSIIYINEDGEKRVKLDEFHPFVWAKNSIAVRMFGGDRAILKQKMHEFGIGVKALITKFKDGDVSDRLNNGYKYLFYAKRKMSFQRFLMFFQMAKTPIYNNSKKNTNEKTVSNREFLSVSPVEQYMIYSGKRLFKGYDNYDNLKRLQFDLETQGLNPEINSIDQIGIRTNKGFEKIISITGEGEERKNNELKAIIEFISILAQEKPDVIAGHNSENFDWNFIIVRCKVLGTSLEDISLQFFKHPIYKKNKESVLKLGGEVEYYKPTIMWGFNIVDSLHAVRRAQAIDSNMKLANLKYVTRYLDLKKTNRVYVPGNKIGTIWLDTNDHSYAFNNTNGDWYKITETRPLINEYKYVSGRYIVERYLLDDIWETDKVELTLNESNFLIGKLLPTTFQRACTMGTAGIWKLILLAWCYERNLAAPSFAPSKRFTGGLSRLLKVGYADRVVKLDYNSLYPSIILTWNIGSKLDISNSMLMMLEYVLSEREKYKGLKGEASKKVNKIEEILKNGTLTEQEKENLEKEKQYWEANASANDKKQLPLKILANSFFGSFGAPDVFPMGDVICAEKTTCIGRMSLRLMISHFTNLGYTPIVGDTDGFNFQMPLQFRYTKDNPYIGKGLGRNTKKGKEYYEVDADVAEFEDLYLNHPFNGGINKMGLGIDEYCPATINFSRKNYADLLYGGKTKKVGNTIKSRRMSGYIEKFLDEGIDLLLKGDGQKFLENYYAYIDKIFNYQIPLRDIASKGKIKKTIEEYKKDCESVTKAGSKKSRQAWYELVIKDNIKVDINDTVYYVNTGTKKAETDVKRITHQYVKIDGILTELDNKIKKQILLKELGSDFNISSLSTKEIKEILKKHIVKEEDEIILNCKLVPNSIIESDTDVLCTDDIEYNVVKYIEQFNKRIKPLLVCFSLDIRDKILIQNPSERQYFTEEQCKLVSGFPNKETDQDTYEQLMKPERKEIEYWLSINERPPFIDECHIDWDALVQDYKEVKNKEMDAIFQEENEKYLKIINSLSESDISDFLDEGNIPSALNNIVELGNDMIFRFKKLPNMTPSTGGYIFDDISLCDNSEKEYESFINNYSE